MSTRLQIAAKRELARRRSKQGASLRVSLSPEQLQFVEDPAKLVVARCGRRAGKSYAVAVRLINTSMRIPNARCVYLSLTRDSAEGILWSTLIQLLNDNGIAHTATRSSLRITFQNGASIRLMGCDSDKIVNRLLGQPWHLAVVDETGYVSTVDDLIARVLMPSMKDFDGTLCMISSPPPVMKGLFYEADQTDARGTWSRHHWTLRENPFFAGRADKILAETIEQEYGGNPDHPLFLREYMGQWVPESTDQFYPISDKNYVAEIPTVAPGVESWTVIGLDLGLRDPNAITVLRAAEDTRLVYELDNWQAADLNVDQLAAVIKRFIEKYKPIAIIADTGGYGAGICKELRDRYGFHIIAADKQDKQFYMEIVKADIISGYCKFLPGSQTARDMRALMRGKDGKEDSRCANHLPDSYLYNYRWLYQRHLKEFRKPMTPDEKMWEDIAARMRVSDDSAFGEDF